MLSRCQNEAEDRGAWSGLAIIGVIVVLAGFTSGLAVATDGPVVEPGTSFTASDTGPTVTINETLTLNDTQRFPDGQTVDLSPNATVSSNGTTNVTIEVIDGPWTNLTTHDVSTDLEVNPQDKQAFTLDGTDVTNLSIRDVDVASGSVDLVYTAAATLNLTLTGLPADAEIEAIDLDTGAVVATDTTNTEGNATFALGSGTGRPIDLREVDSGNGGGGDGGAGGGGVGGVGSQAGSPQEVTAVESGIRFSKAATDESPDQPGVTVRFEPTAVDGEVQSPPVDEITFDTDVAAAGRVEVIATQETPSPETVDSAAESVVRSFELSAPGSLQDAPATISFTVSRAELGDREPDVVRLARQRSGGDWQTYTVTPIDPSADPITFHSEVDGFSRWAVVLQGPSTLTVTPTATPTATPSGTERPTPTAATTATEVAEGQPGFGLVLPLLALGIVRWLSRRLD